jgi:hypothetical protein
MVLKAHGDTLVLHTVQSSTGTASPSASCRYGLLMRQPCCAVDSCWVTCLKVSFILWHVTASWSP